MVLRSNKSINPVNGRAARVPGRQAFTLIEVLVVMLLLSILLISSAAGIMAMNRSSTRLADYTAAMAVAEAKMHSIRAATYNPPTDPFTASTVTLNNTASISLSKYGTNFLVAGTVVSKIQPVSAGHLVTVTATFQEPSGAITVSLQSLINRFTTGQQ